MTYRLVRLPSGREAGMTGLGDPAGERLAVLLHPTPGASGFDPAPDVTARSGIHLLTFERPGYGATDPSEPGVDGWADDLAGYLREAEAGARNAAGTGYGGIGVVGWREGGIYATALAARHPELVNRLALVAAPAPSRAADALRRSGQPVLTGGPGEPLGYPDRVRRMLDTAATQGDAGVLADRHAFQMPEAEWGRIDTATLILYGTTVAYATVQDAQWYAGIAPQARVERVDGGADIIGRHWQRVLDFLAE
ncbi:alpha/beta fold hydrolase [Leifsonia poae]|uniref:alpha/beta fold hydrolase n=1 Tax=Leifsonia poae TaxID=110933 RepID=UPI003D68FA34